MSRRTTKVLEQMLGKSVRDFDWADIEKIVELKLEEGQELEFKSEHYASDDVKKRELAKDLVAFANTTGGVLLIGIREDGQGKANSINAVSIAEGEVLRYRQIIASKVQPLLNFETYPITSPDDATLGVLIIVIPRSDLAPHCQMVDTTLRFSRRYVATTLDMQEKDLADAYRERFSHSQSKTELAVSREMEFLNRLEPNEIWLVVTLIPDFPGSLILDREIQTEIQSQLVGKRVLPFTETFIFHNIEVGYRRVFATEQRYQLSALAKYWALEIHTDGSGVFAVKLASEANSDERRSDLLGAKLIDDQQVVDGILAALKWLGFFAWQSGASGQANFRVRIGSKTFNDKMALTYKNSFISVHSGRAVSAPLICDLSVSLVEIEAEGVLLVNAAFPILRDVGQAFGVIDLGYIDSSGNVRFQQWSEQNRLEVKAWAEAHSIGNINGMFRSY